jgi:hypothetical protein
MGGHGWAAANGHANKHAHRRVHARVAPSGGARLCASQRRTFWHPVPLLIRDGSDSTDSTGGIGMPRSASKAGGTQRQARNQTSSKQGGSSTGPCCCLQSQRRRAVALGGSRLSRARAAAPSKAAPRDWPLAPKAAVGGPMQMSRSVSDCLASECAERAPKRASWQGADTRRCSTESRRCIIMAGVVPERASASATPARKPTAAAELGRRTRRRPRSEHQSLRATARGAVLRSPRRSPRLCLAPARRGSAGAAPGRCRRLQAQRPRVLYKRRPVTFRAELPLMRLDHRATPRAS